MKAINQVIEYVADDGTVFRDQAKCLIHDKRVVEMAKIMSPLGKIPSNGGCAFENGTGWIEHDRDTVIKVIKAILKMAKKTMDHKWIDQTSADVEKISPTWVGRLFDDSGDRILYGAWRRIMCIDMKTGNEYGQPYYALNPSKAEGSGIKPVL